MKKELGEKQLKIIEYVGMAILLFLFFWMTRNAIFGAHEEYGLFYIVQKGDFFSWLNYISRDSGRITFYVLSWFWAGPMFLGPVAYKISICLLITIDIIVFYHLLSTHVNKKFAIFATTFIIITFQISTQHNLLISYNYLHIPFILLMISAHLLLNYCKGKMGYGAVVASALCSFAASYFQENFVLFYLFSFCIVFCYERRQGFWKKVGSALWKLKFHVLGGAVFLATYFGFRLAYSTGSYDGNSICLSQPLTSLEVLVRFITGMVPGRSFKVLASTVGLKETLAFIGKKDLVFILIATLFICYVLKHTERFKKPGLLYGAMALCSVLACILHSVSLQYVTWVSMGTTYAYVPSYYCCFFVNTFVCLIVHEIYSRLRKTPKRIFMIIFAVIIFGVTSMTVATNNYYNREYQTKFDHYESYRDYFKAGGIDDWEDSAQVLIVDDYPVEAVDIHQCMTTVRYDAFFFTVTKDLGELDLEKNYYILTYDNGTLSAEKIEPGE